MVQLTTNLQKLANKDVPSERAANGNCPKKGREKKARKLYREPIKGSIPRHKRAMNTEH